ncbi:MAG: carotenoid cleavage dioxygenase-like enzyme [Kiritimatiellia bacterium]|jgi:carotenoid cleavage dioxygenase-like enzyme
MKNASHTARLINAEVQMERAHFLAEAALEHAATQIASISGYVPNTLTGSATEAQGG